MISMVRTSHYRQILNTRVSQTNTDDGVRGTRRKGRDAGNGAPEAGANEIMLELISLGGKAGKAVKRYPIFHPACGDPRINPSLEDIRSGKKRETFEKFDSMHIVQWYSRREFRWREEVMHFIHNTFLQRIRIKKRHQVII